MNNRLTAMAALKLAHLLRSSSIRSLVSILAVTLLVTACGGGGGDGSSPNSTAPNSGSATVNLNTIVMSDAQTAQIARTIANPDGTTQLVTTANSTLGATLAVGNVVLVTEGADTRFPLGLVGKITSVTTGSDGVTSAVLTNATLAEVVQKSNFQATEVALDSTNFVGVISPKAVQASATTPPRSLSVLQQGTTALNGGLVLSEPNSLGRAVNQIQRGLSVLGGNGTVDVGEIKLTLGVKLPAMGLDLSRFKPYGTGTEASFNIVGSIKNLKLIENHDFDTTFTGLKSVDMRVTGDIDVAVNLHGGVEADLGYFSQAWKEVEDEQFKLLGASAKLTGLDSKDKIGKFPIAGLVFSAPCPPLGCPIIIGQTQTPLRAAKAGGIIVWVYLTASGKIVLDGEVGARLNAARLNLGVQKPEGGKLGSVFELSNAGTGRLIEAPYFDGEAGATLRFGPTFDADFFTLGVRVATVSAFIGGQYNATLKTTTPISYGTTRLGDPWTLDGQACLQSSSIGAGAIVSAAIDVGVEIDTLFKKTNFSFAYGGSWPTEDEILIPGGHGFGNLTWHSASASNKCFPTPVVNKITTTQNASTRSLTITVSGANLPDDLLLDVSPAANCTGLQKNATSGTSVSFTCQIGGAVTGLGYNLTSHKAENIDLSAVYNQLAYTAIPSAPDGVSPVAGNGQASISWNAVAGATSFNLYMASVSGVTKSNYSTLPDGMKHASVTSPYVDIGLANGKTYYYVVTAVNASGESGEGGNSGVAVTPRSILNDRVLMLSQRDGNWEIYLVGLDGSNPINLTKNPAADRLPSLSPERGRIAFVSERNGNNEIYVMTSDGANPTRLTSNSADDVSPAWSPDGKKIAFVSKRDGNYEIYVMDASGGNQLRLTNTPADESFPSWSPDSKRLSFVSKRDGNEEIYVMNADATGAAVNLTNNTASDNIPFFSPDGAWISFVSNRGGGYNLWVMDTNGSNLRKITTATNNIVGWYAWSPDGTQIAFDSKADGDYEVYVINFDGTNLRQLTTNTVADQFAAWTWDGKKIVFISKRSGKDQIYAMDPDGGNPVNVSNDTSSVALPMASPVYQTGGGCFIATAAYGSYLEPEVMVLREFRDRYLLTNDIGKVFVTYYYKWSPPVADYIKKHASLRLIVRIGLTPLVYGFKYPVGVGTVLVLMILSFSFRRVCRLCRVPQRVGVSG